MNEIIDIGLWQLAAAYLLLAFPFGIMLWYRVPMIGETVTALIRMTVQLIFVGLYLQVIFKLNILWLNAAWLVVMVVVADVSIVRSCTLRLRRIALPLFVALLAGTAVPLLLFTGLILRRPNLLDAQYAIPIGGKASQAALAPTVATTATIGLVSLPGMMTGVILGGASPAIAIKYQIAIMISIFSGTAITIALGIRLTSRTSFTSYGVPDPTLFRGASKT